MSDVEKVKERADIREIISQYVKLQKAGKNFKGVCPFHNEKTPSFFVSPDRQSFYCFGCSKGGDVFSFLEAIEGIQFKDALVRLAEKTGVTLSGKEGKKEDYSRLYSALSLAKSYFIDTFKSQTDALTYLHNRGLNEDTIKRFGIGYAVDEWRSLSTFLLNKGYTEEELKVSGLIKQSPRDDEKFYDTFRGRIMFPIHNASGICVGFSGRIFPDQENIAKYLNSPETPVFHKSYILYCFSEAKQAIRKNDFAILVEGQMDALLSHQAGYRNTVAVSGTSLSAGHVQLISRMTKNCVLVFDADKAGERAGLRASRIFLEHGFHLKIADIAEGTDPADVIGRNPDEWKRAIREAEHVVLFYLKRCLKEESKEKQKESISKDVLPLLHSLSNKIQQDHYIKEVAERSDITESALREELLKINTESVITYEEESVASVHDSEFLMSRKEQALLLLLGFVLFAKGDTTIDKEFHTLASFIDEELKKLGFENMHYDDGAVSAQALRAETLSEDKDFLKRYVLDLLSTVEEGVLRERIEFLADEMREFEKEGAKEDAKKATRMYQEEITTLHKLLDKRHAHIHI